MNSINKFFSLIRHSYGTIFKVSLFVAFIIIVVWQMPRTMMFKYEYQRSVPWKHATLYAPFDFAVYKDDDKLKAEREEALRNIYPIFVMDESLTKDGRDALVDDIKTYFKSNETDGVAYGKMALKIYDTIERIGVMSHHPILDAMKNDDNIVLLVNRVVNNISVGDVLTLQKASDIVSDKVASIGNASVSAVLNRIIINSLRQNVFYSDELTKQSRAKALSEVSLTYGMVQKDELIISENEIVNDDKFMILNSLQKEYNIHASSLFSKNYLLFGQFVMVAVIVIMMFLMFKTVTPLFYAETKSVVLVLLLMTIFVISYFLALKFDFEFVSSVIPIVILPMLLMSFFDVRITFTVNVLVLILISFAIPNPFRFFFTQMFVMMIPIFILNKYRNRYAYMLTSAAVFVTYSVLYLGSVLVYDGGFNMLSFRVVGAFFLNALLSLMALPLIFLIERLFGYVTNMTLLELSNTNTPLLRRLATEAPGTFQHTMLVADICEELIRAVGGNALLGRTGAMYHDVGKLKSPLFFVENQNSKFNPHDEYSYSESAQIIIGHVLSGIELCHEYNVPEEIIDFVRTHHGTRFTYYFYNKEKEINPNFDESEFRYHGPNPFSKETAILMIADSVEAASRSVKNKDAGTLEALVENLVDGQANSGQFLNTDLTQRDLITIKKVLKKKLMSIYHVRIEYPE